MKGKSKAVTTTIRATSRASIKLGDNFYTVEWCEERSVPEDCDIEEERSLLWDIVNDETYAQVEEITEEYRNRKNKRT